MIVFFVKSSKSCIGGCLFLLFTVFSFFVVCEDVLNLKKTEHLSESRVCLIVMCFLFVCFV